MSSRTKHRAEKGAASVAVLLAAALGGCGGPMADAAPTIVVAPAGGSNPTAAVDSRDGTSYVAWVGTDSGGVYNVYLASAARGDTAFSAPVRVNDIPGDAAPHEQAPAQVAVGPKGRIYVAWQNNTPAPDRNFPTSNLRFAVSTDGGATFSPAINVNDDADGLPSSHTFHNVAVAPDGTVYVSWIDGRVKDAFLAAHPEMAEGMTMTMGDTPGTADTESMASMHASEMHGASMHPAGVPNSEIRVSRSTDGGATFEPATVLDSDACPCCRTSLAIGPDGAVYVGWRHIYDGNIRDVVVARAEPGTLDFGEPVRVHDDEWHFPGCPHAGPAVAVDSAGRVHVAWYTGREGRQGLWYAVSEDGGKTFGAPDALLTADWVPPSQVALTAEGNSTWIAWDDRRTEEPVRTVARATESAAPVPASRASAPGESPSLGASNGSALVAWVSGDSVEARWVGRDDAK